MIDNVTANEIMNAVSRDGSAVYCLNRETLTGMRTVLVDGTQTETQFDKMPVVSLTNIVNSVLNKYAGLTGTDNEFLRLSVEDDILTVGLATQA